jgi:hypothetical protein
MELNMMATGLMGKRLVTASSFMQMVISMKAIGKTTKLMEKEFI